MLTHKGVKDLGLNDPVALSLPVLSFSNAIDVELPPSELEWLAAAGEDGQLFSHVCACDALHF
ncbi:MAG TPA: hypothetical protein VKE72_05955 [Methylocella sp.]|nr:hypothetical protein [Methylocella sp.]